jgi:hypothetical protein
MKRLTCAVAAMIVLEGLVPGQPARADDEEPPRFEVTVTNLTRGQTFTPVLVVSHRAGVTLFTLGEPASEALAMLAEEGNTAPLTALLLATPGVRDAADSGPPPAGFVPPGQSKTIIVDGGRGADHLSVAAMLISTNDGFFALNGERGRRGREILTYFSVAYDSGSERNDESCASIPGPFFASAAAPGVAGSPRAERRGTSTSTRASMVASAAT